MSAQITNEQKPPSIKGLSIAELQMALQGNHTHRHPWKVCPWSCAVCAVLLPQREGDLGTCWSRASQ